MQQLTDLTPPNVWLQPGARIVDVSVRDVVHMCHIASCPMIFSELIAKVASTGSEPSLRPSPMAGSGSGASMGAESPNTLVSPPLPGAGFGVATGSAGGR